MRDTPKSADDLPAKSRVAYAYLTAKEQVIQSGYGEEIEWQIQRNLLDVTETDFLREAAWVVLSAGMRETVIRSKFPAISRAFLDWSSASAISHTGDGCISAALLHFSHRQKIQAISSIAQKIATEGFEAFWARVRCEPEQTLCQLPYIGPITWCHLAKNLGFPLPKADRHLARLKSAMGFDSVTSMCMSISDAVEDSLAVVDIVLWRFATLEKNYVHFFTSDLPEVRYYTRLRRQAKTSSRLQHPGQIPQGVLAQSQECVHASTSHGIRDC